MQTTRTPYSISFMATVLLLLLFACHSTVANAAVALGATRVIYPANQKQVLLPVTNNDPASVYLIQSWIENAGDQKDTQFVITPPLFSMQGKKENTLRIINATNHQLPGDRESLFWVNVKAIPAMEKDQKNENTLQLAIISRIKMFYRPTNLAMAPEEAPAMLRFRRSGSFTWNIISNNNVVMPTGGCTVDSRNVTVDLPDFPGSAEIPLGVYCSSEQKLSFYLSGATTDSSRQVFANTAPDATKASGVGVSLMRNGKILATGENVSLGTVNKSKVPLGLSATYGQTGNKVSAGTVQSVIGVTFIYE
ncbi:TPA: fimbria/pilus periplasmic chaperone [Escherichia coli]|nr:fimbria/pilus periplasmic chaperone [Escherichia coli]